MPNAIHELPEEKNWGLDFNYDRWSPGTKVTLCNVPWSNDYRDLVRFPSEAALSSYVTENAGYHINVEQMSYARFGLPIKLSIPFNTALKFNYIRAFNPAQPIDGDFDRAFYYFISDVIYINPSTTHIYVQLDMWQTFGYQMEFGNCYIERGHIGIANQNNFNEFGRQFLTTPEGMDVGGEYRIDKRWENRIAQARDIMPLTDVPPWGGVGSGQRGFEIMVVSTVNLEANPGTTEKPNLESARGSRMQNLPNGAEVYIFTGEEFNVFMYAYSKFPWVTQGIVSISAVPPTDRYDIRSDTVTFAFGEGGSITAKKISFGTLQSLNHANATNWRDTVDLGRYSRLKKFLTYPYCVLEMTTHSGTPLMLKPESWQDAHATVVEVPHLAPPNARVMFYPYRYNAGSAPIHEDQNGIVHDGGEFMDVATGITNMPTFSLVNNASIGYLASNANGIAFQYTSNDWSQQKALQGAGNAYNTASSGVAANTNSTLANNKTMHAQNRQAMETEGYRGIQSGANAVAGILGDGNLINAAKGVANSVASYAINTNQMISSTNIASDNQLNQMQIQNKQANYVNNTNFDYAKYAANGDYANTIAGIQAKVQDAQLIQPTTSGQMGGEAFNLATWGWGTDIKLKMLNSNAMATIGEFWLRYGYAVNRFGKMPDNFQVMSHATYWKLSETTIIAAQCPEIYRQGIRGIFEKGVTVWNNPNDIGRLDFGTNIPLEGVTL